MIKTEILTITPTEAKRMLEGNTNNRKLSKDRVAQLAGIIKEGRWAMNGESIKFNGKQLLDGQHRLHAIVEANKPIKTLVVRGLDAGVFATLDQQKKRSAADALFMSHEEYPVILAAGISIVNEIRNGSQTIKTSRRSSNDDYVRFVKKEPGIRDSVRFTSTHQGMLTKLAGVAIPTAMHYLFCQADETRGNEFMEDLHTGLCYDKNDPVYLLRQKLISNSTTARKMDRTMICALFIKAWNARFTGQPLKRLVWDPKKESFPTIATELE